MATAPPRQPRLRLGVVGLGRLWEARYRPALARMADRARVVALYDQVARRATAEAAALRCAAVDGLTDLIDRPDIDALLLLTPQWFGLHPVALAAERGKPVYCALPVAGDPGGLEDLAPRIVAGGAAFVPELARRAYPASVRLKELLATKLGPARLILGHVRLGGFDRYGAPGPSSQTSPSTLLQDPGGNVVDWCRWVFGAEPTTVQGVGAVAIAGEVPGRDFESIALGFDGGGLARVDIAQHHRAAWGENMRLPPAPGFAVYAERGYAWLEMPDALRWVDADGPRDERLPLEPTLGEVLLDQFLKRIRGEPSDAPGLDDALAASRLVARLKGG